jgi:uncharacterized protein YjbI with pentapeptide repeats
MSQICAGTILSVLTSRALILPAQTCGHRCFTKFGSLTTNPNGADLRQSSFRNCDFAEAVLTGTMLTRQQASTMLLSEKQRREIDWRDEDGPEPGGG